MKATTKKATTKKATKCADVPAMLLAAARSAAGAWAGFITAFGAALHGLDDKAAASAVADAAKTAETPTLRQYVSDAWAIVRAERAAAAPKAPKTEAAALQDAIASGNGKRQKIAARAFLVASGAIKPRAPRQPVAKRASAPRADAAMQECRALVVQLRAALEGRRVPAAASDALAALAALLHLDAESVELAAAA